MARKIKQLPLFTELEVTDVAAEGKALIKHDEMVIFTQYVVPGDVVDVQITKKKHHYMEGRVLNIHRFSEKRSDAFCSHYGVCGGCKWQILPYNEQLFYKQKQVMDNLVRIAKVELPEPMLILGSAKPTFYRNKLEYTFSNKRWMTYEDMASGKELDTMNAVGFHIPGMFDKVLDIDKCWLQDDISNQIRNEVRRYALDNNLTFFDLRNQEGFLRTLIVRTSSTGQLMVIMSFFYEDKPARIAFLQHIADKFPQITSLMYVINNKANDTLTDQNICVFNGSDAIYEEMEGLKFKIGPKSFYQTNSEQAYELYSVVRRFADLKGNELVYDLYTGTGTIANFLAKQCSKVIGIEYVPEAIEDAKINAELNGLMNTLFFAGDMKDVLNKNFIAEHGIPDVVVTDPPRAGMHDDVIKTLLFIMPRRIVYVSCNPATQARDISLLDEHYKVVAIQPVDMFPHTQHVENVLLLEKR